MYACKSYSTARSFTINQSTTGVPLLETIHKLEIYPNPIQAGESIRLRFEADENMPLNAVLANSLGEVVHQQKIQTSVGTNDYLLNPNLLPVGIYHLWLKGERGAISKKLIVH
jgi:Secretion system C-terminal sorting domain